MVRIGIIGLGGLAAGHWRALEEVQRSGACQIVAAAAVDPEDHPARLEELRGRGVSVFNSTAEMLDAMGPKMDAVTIPSPIHLRPELTIAAVQSGYHVFLESPPAATIQEVDEMTAAVRRSGRVCAVGFETLWSQSMSLLKMRIAEDALGPVRQVTCSAGWMRKAGYFSRADWAGRLRVGKGWVLDGTANNPPSQQIAAMLYLAVPEHRRLASPASVRAELYAGHDIESDDTVAIEIFTGEGPRCTFLASLCTDEQFPPEIVVLGEAGAAYRSDDGRVCIRYEDGRVEEPAVDDGRQEVEKFENFVAAAAAGDTDLLRCDLAMCRPFTLAVNGAFESAQQVRPIPPQYLTVTGDGPGRKVVVEGLDAAICQAASQRRLFSDLQLPWAHRTSAVDLADYKHFPRQFTPGRPKEEPVVGELPFG